jgi:hypothetical protein
VLPAGFVLTAAVRQWHNTATKALKYATGSNCSHKRRAIDAFTSMSLQDICDHIVESKGDTGIIFCRKKCAAELRAPFVLARFLMVCMAWCIPMLYLASYAHVSVSILSCLALRLWRYGRLCNQEKKSPLAASAEFLLVLIRVLLQLRVDMCSIHCKELAQQINEWMEAQGYRYRVGAYNGSEDEWSRKQVHGKWQEGRLTAVCATWAFSYGIHKPDVRCSSQSQIVS